MSWLTPDRSGAVVRSEFSGEKQVALEASGDPPKRPTIPSSCPDHFVHTPHPLLCNISFPLHTGLHHTRHSTVPWVTKVNEASSPERNLHPSYISFTSKAEGIKNELIFRIENLKKQPALIDKGSFLSAELS